MERRVVTPEAVALDLQTATVATRGLAALLDLALQVVAFVLVALAAQALDTGSTSGTALVTITLLSVFVIRILYPLLMEVRFGATLGHMALGLRVVTLDGAPIRARQALARVAVGIFELETTLGAVALLVAASRTDGRRLGDLAGGTQVVSVRVGTGAATALELDVPPALTGWATSLDTSALDAPERAALRRYLSRAAQLPAARRDELAAGLADRLLPRLAAPRPAGVSAHEVLVAVAATAQASTPPPPSAGERDDGRPPPPTAPSAGHGFEPPA